MADPATPRTQHGSPAAVGAVQGVRRLRAAWRALSPEQRLAGLAALALLVTMFLPWYSGTRAIRVKGQLESVTNAHSAISVFSWVEAAVLLVAAAVLAMLFARAERRAFHLPGGDGAVILGAGLWTCLLIVWRLFDKPDLGAGVTEGLRWGIFVALGAAAFLAYAGNRLRAAHRPEPPLRRPAPERQPDEPIEIHLPAERPHLAETRVMPERRPGEQAPPLSRAAAEQDTAEFRAAREREQGQEEPAQPPPGPEEDGEEGGQPRLPGV
jgi:hypothetical protein